MTNLKDIIAYIVKQYPYADELSNARLTKMVYLADWEHVKKHGQQISNIKWYYDNYGPYVADVRNEAKKQKDLFAIEETANMYGNKKSVISMKDSAYKPELNPQQKEAIDYIIGETKEKGWNNFIEMVYSTYPIQSSKQYSYLDLLDKDRELKKQSAD